MRLLASLCNANQYNSQFALAVVEVDSGDARLVDCSAFLDFRRDGGISGLCRTDRGLAIAVQSSEPRVVMMDDRFHERWTASDPRLMDVHSLTFHEGRLFAMSSGRNKILEIDPETGSVGLFWEYGPADTPFLHLNSLAFHAGQAVVCSHRLPPEANHPSTTGGCWRLDDWSVVLPGLRSPHTLTALDGGLVCLSSADGRIVTWREGEVAETSTPGYLRGLCVMQDQMVVGCSAMRFISRKAPGIKRYADFNHVVGNPAYMSNLVVCDRDFNELRRIPTTALGFEIYDVVEDPGVPDAWLAARSTAVRMQTMQRLTITLREQLQALRHRAGAEEEAEA